jgi:hypothetical protein
MSSYFLRFIALSAPPAGPVVNAPINAIVVLPYLAIAAVPLASVV